MMIMTNELFPQYDLQPCKNCNGYGTKGYAKIKCPTCKGEGSVKIPLIPFKVLAKDLLAALGKEMEAESEK